MKKFSREYFEKKFNVLYKKLLVKDGFLDVVKETRKELGLPEDGFKNETQLAQYLMSKMSEEEHIFLDFTVFSDNYFEINPSIIRNEDDYKKREESYKIICEEYSKRMDEKERFDEADTLAMITFFAASIDNHVEMITRQPILSESKNKYLSNLFPATLKLINKFWTLDLLDELIAGYYIERYLFLGEYGVRKYIHNRLSCSNCRYIGVNHFSPMGSNMTGQDEGVYSKNYIFNEDTVRLLSKHFNSVFLIIKPYASKEEALQYIEDNWDSLKEHIIDKNDFYEQMGVHPSKIKDSDFEKKQLVYELNKKSKKELLKLYKGKFTLPEIYIYKESVISSILKEQYGIEMSAEAIKKSASRFAKEVKSKRQPKDIEDI